MKDLLELLLNPKYLKSVILIVGILVLFRNIYYLLFSDVTLLFKFGAQPPIEISLDIQVPMLLMTVLWPIVFALLNRIDERIKINNIVFNIILAVHLFTCLFAAYLINNEGCLPPECENSEFLSVFWGGAGLTMISVAISYSIFNAKSLFTVSKENA